MKVKLLQETVMCKQANNVVFCSFMYILARLLYNFTLLPQRISLLQVSSILDLLYIDIKSDC